MRNSHDEIRSPIIANWVEGIETGCPQITRSLFWQSMRMRAEDASVDQASEAIRAKRITNWLCATVLPKFQEQADEIGVGKEWQTMCLMRTSADAAAVGWLLAVKYMHCPQDGEEQNVGLRSAAALWVIVHVMQNLFYVQSAMRFERSKAWKACGAIVADVLKMKGECAWRELYVPDQLEYLIDV